MCVCVFGSMCKECNLICCSLIDVKVKIEKRGK